MQLNSLSIPGCRNIIITITTIKMHQIRPPITFSCLWLHVKVPTLKCLKLNKNFEYPLNESSPYSSVLPLTWTWDLPLLERPPWFWMNATEQNIQVRFPPPLSIAIGLDLLFLIFEENMEKQFEWMQRDIQIPSSPVFQQAFSFCLALFVSIWRGNVKSKIWVEYMPQNCGTFWTLQLEANFRLPSCPVPSDQEIGSPIVDWEGYHYPTILPPNPLEFSNTSGNFRSYITAAAQ